MNQKVLKHYAEAVKKFKATSTKWKLEWLEEANRLTNACLTGEAKTLRAKIRKSAFFVK